MVQSLMRRKIRLDQRLSLTTLDGKTVDLDAGTYWIEERGNAAKLSATAPGGIDAVPMSVAEVEARLARREFVYVSW